MIDNKLMNQYTFDDKITVLSDLNTLNIPELSEIFNLETNPYYFESITNSENVAVNEMILGFNNKQKFIGQVNSNVQLKTGDKIVEYWVDGSVEIIGTKTFNWAHMSNPFKVFFKETTQIKFYDLAQLKAKLQSNKSRYFWVELNTSSYDILYLCFDTILSESFYISFSGFKLDLDEFDFVQAVDYFSSEVGYIFNSDKNLKFSDGNNPDSVLLLTWLLLTFKTSDLHNAISTIIKSETTSAIGYTILKTWIWYNYLIGTSCDVKNNNLVAKEA